MLGMNVLAETTHRRHELIRAAYPGDLVLVKMFLYKPLHVLIPFHEADVGQIDAEQDSGLVPIDVVVTEEQDKCDKRDRVEGTVAKQGPPGEREDGPGEQSAHPDDEEDIEYRATDDGADADVVERHEHADYGSE